MRLEKKATVVSTSVVALFNYFALHNSEKSPDDSCHSLKNDKQGCTQ